jgi:hypothetical protein
MTTTIALITHIIVVGMGIVRFFLMALLLKPILLIDLESLEEKNEPMNLR